MGALYERYLAEQQQKGGPLYQQYLASQKPGILETAKNALEGVGHAIVEQGEHAVDALTAPVVGEKIPINAKTGRSNIGYLPVGATITKQNAPGAITPEEQKRDVIETSALALAGPTEGLAAETLAKAGAGKLLAHILASSAANAGVGAVLSPNDRLRGAEMGAGIGAILPGAGMLAKRGGSAILGAAGRALTPNVTDDLDEAIASGLREGTGDEQFVPLEAIAQQNARAAIESEPPSSASALLRQAQEALAKGQATGAAREAEGVPYTINRRPPPNGGAPTLREALAAHDAAIADAQAGSPGTLDELHEALRSGADVSDRAIDRLVPTETPFDTPDVKRIRAEMEALGPTSDIPDDAPATASQFPDVTTRGELRQAAADRLYGAGAAKKERQAWVVTGPPAAGKSELFAKPLAREHGALMVDNDDVKDMLDESLGGRHNGRVAGESADIAGRTLGRAVDAGDNIVLPVVGRTEGSLQQTLQILQDRGYAVHLVHNDLPATESAARAMGRAQRTGKLVDPRYILHQVADLPGQVFQSAKSHPAVSTFRSFSNDVPQGTAPRLVEEGGPGLTAADAAQLRSGGRGGLGAGDSSGDQTASGASPAAGATSEVARSRLGGLDGHDSEAFFQEREVPVRYRVVEAEDITPSNNPDTFERNPAYPQVIQGRTYHGDVGRAAREQVISGTQGLNAKKLLNPGSNVGGPPIITPDGLAIAGNQRSMMLQRAAAAQGPQYAGYRQLLAERAQRFGIDPAELATFKHPVLVREITDPSIDVTDHEQLRQLNAASDAPTLKTKDPLSDANTRAAQLRANPEALASLAQHLDPDETIRQHLDRRGLEFFRELQQAGVVTPQEMARYYDRTTGKVTEEGKTLAERLVQLSAVPNPDVIKATPDAVLRRLEHSFPAVVAAGTRPEWSLEQPLTQALELTTAARKSAMTVSEFLNQGDAFNRSWSEEAAALARTIEDTKKPTALADKFRAYADAAAASERMGQSESLFGDTAETPPQAFSRIFGANAPARSGSIGTHMLTSIGGAGAGGAFGATQGDTPEERRANAAKYAALGLALGAGVPYLLRTAPRAALVEQGLRLSADPSMVLANVRGAVPREQLDQLLEQVRANPDARFRYVIRDAAGRPVSTGTSLADFFADMPHAGGGARSGAIGEQPARGAGSPFRAAYRPKTNTLPPPVSNEEMGAPVHQPIPKDLDPDDYLNFSTVLLDPSGEQRLRETVAQVAADNGLHPKARVPWETTKKIAATMGLSPEDLVKKGDLGRLSGAEMLAIRNIVVDNVSRSEEIDRQLALDPAMTAVERETLQRISGALDRQNDVLLSRFVQARTQTARDFNNLKIVAQQTLDPVVWLSKAKQIRGNQPVTDEIRARVMQLVNAGDRRGLAEYVAKLREPTMWDKLLTVWKAGLLTAPTTHMANALGNTTMAALETTKDIPAAALDAMLSAVTGQRTKNLSLAGTIEASLKGASQGFNEAKDIMVGRATGDGLTRYDLTREIDFKNAFLDRYTKTVFRSLTASDRIFKQAALYRSIAEQARVVARAGGFTGNAYDAEVQRLIQAPTDEMALRALHDAEIATFQDEGALAKAAQGLRKPLGPAGHLILPFASTPANVATRALEYSPFGPLMRIGDVMKLFDSSIQGAEKYDIQKRIVETLGRSAVGSAPIVAGYLLARAGRMTGGYPANKTQRDEQALEGKQPNSVMVGGKWHSMERVSPLGNLMGLGAAIYEAFSDAQASLSEKIGASAGALGKTVAEQSFLTGISGAIDFIQDPERSAGKFLRQQATSIVPTIVGKLARAVDPTVREHQTLGQDFLSRIPFASKKLPAKVDQLGHTVTGQGGVAAVLDPTMARTDRGADDPVVAELERVGASLPALTRKKNEAPDAFYKRRKVYGVVARRVLQTVAQSPQYGHARQLAEALVARDPRFRGQDPRTLAAEVQKGILEKAVEETRRQLTLNGIGQ